MDAYDAEGYQVLESSPIEELRPPSVARNYDNLEFSDDESDTDGHPQRKPQRYRRTDANEQITKKRFKDCMDDDEALEVEDITELTRKDRWRLYNYWEEQWFK